MQGIAVSNLEKRYGEHIVLQNVNLTIKKPGVYLIAGPNGSGKTTLLEILAGLRGFKKGNVIINSHQTDHQQLKQQVGFLTQQNTLRKNCTVAEELNLIKDIFQLDIDTYQYLEKFKLQEYYRKKTKQLSGGTKRRVLIAMLFMPKYKIVILDEPVSGLDTFSRDEIWNRIKEYSENNIVVVSDHYLNQAAQYSDCVYLLNKGRIVLHGETEKILHDFDKKYVIKTRKDYLKEIEKAVNGTKSLADVKVSGSVYNLFINQSDMNVISSLTNDKRFALHSVDLEDIYFYYTGDVVHKEAANE